MKSSLFILLLSSVLLLGCSQSSRLEQALEFAGENRAELEKVLAHYSQNIEDSLKYKAACFLIENMPGHYSYKNADWLAQYYTEIGDSVSLDYDYVTNGQIVERISARYSGNKTRETVFDLQILTANFLINNIERAFAVWQQPDGWATHVSFADFCEYILPYKGCELQPIDNWREYAEDLLKADLDTLPFCDLYRNSAFKAATAVSKEIIGLNQQYYPFGGVNAIPIRDIITLTKMPFGSCDDYALLALAVMRSKGIPVIQDYTPQWPFQPQSHSWNIVLNNKGKNMVFSAGSSNPGELHNTDDKMAKVFRKTYAINREILQIHTSEKYIPATFKNFFIKDVTTDYVSVSDMEIVIPNELKNQYQYAYLAVFNNKEWIPVHYGKVLGNKVRFTDMGRNCMYLPVFYGEQGIVPFSAPLLLTAQGTVKRLEADKNKLQTLTVYRKYFIAGHCYEVGRRMMGGEFQAANQADFRDAVTVYKIPGFTVQSGEVRLNTEKPYRYWRYYSAKEGYNNLAELYFYLPGKERPVYGKIIGTTGSYTHRKDSEKEVVFDNDPLTFFDAPTPNDTWVGMDFGEPVKIEKIAYTPRGDGNDITPGDQHEVLYWDDNHWISLGKREATDIQLAYENVPANALFWIRNLSRGNDERIFTYEDGKQIWW
ncbi:hypothetical protein FACS189426_11080 [Bacteroidia bacterium]|nr:hypothetical protein FACS189426_11080 [Bacteroidia bacterium]